MKMKKIITLTLGCLIGLSMVKAQTFSDNFEADTVGLLGPQSTSWTTWSGVVGGANDAHVVSTDNHTAGGSKSIYYSSTSSTGGPTDCVLKFGAAPLTTGQFTYSAWFKIPTGKDGYFNFQGNTTMGNLYTLDCYMDNTGNVTIQNSGTTMVVGAHPFGTWFNLTIDANLNTNTWNLLINSVSQGTWHNTADQVYAIDIYPADATASYWMDDVSYNVVPYTLPSINGALNLIGITNGIVGQSRTAAVTVRNQGTTAITSFDLSTNQNGGTPVVQNITGVSIPSLGTYLVNVSSPFTLLTGANTFTSIISNVNGAGPDADASDDTINTIITPVTPAAGKMVVAEEGTGTWCGYCVRGAVFMEKMSAKYSGYFAGIAVHNNDPMIDTAYNAGITPFISGYPTVLIDRLTGVDPSVMENDFLSRIIIVPKAFIVNGATYNAGTRVLKVSVTTTMQANISGNYRMACAITEDSVTGTTSGYDQHNYYSGGSLGPMGGFELLPNPVPAAQMNYNHVGRIISPDFAGLPSAFGASATTGQIFTYTFTYTLPATWDANQIHIVGMFIDPTGKIDNASSATIAQAVTNGYVSGTEIGTTGIAEVNQPDVQISLYPNPATNNATISLNLVTESTVQVAIYEVNGALVAKKEYGKLSGGMLLPIEMAGFNSGMYFVNVTIDGKTSMMKLVKQ
jgi:hypothetical protein